MQIDDEKDCRIKHVYPIAEMIIKQAKEFKNAVPQKKPTTEEIQRLKLLFAERLKALGIHFRKSPTGKMNNAIEILANRYGEIITIAMLAKDLNCSDQSTRDVMRILVQADIIKSSFKGINGKATKILQLKLEESSKEVKEPEPVIEEKICEAPIKEIAAPAGIKIEKIIVNEIIENKAELVIKKEVLLEKPNELINTICLKYGFCETQKKILIGLANAPGRVLKMNELRKLEGIKKVNNGNFDSYLADLRNHKVIEVKNKATILKT